MAQVGGDPGGVLELWVVADVGARDDPRARQATAHLGQHVFAGDGVGVAPYEEERAVGALERGRPAVGVVASLVDALDQPVVVAVPVAAGHAEPELVHVVVARLMRIGEDGAHVSSERALVPKR